jgi:small-conductance mechanosensitive channel
MDLIKLLQTHLFQILPPLSVFVVTLILGLLARRLIFASLARWAIKTSGQIDDIIVRAVKGPFMIWVLMLALHLAAQVSPLPARIGSLMTKVLLFLLIVSITVVGSKMASEIVKVYGARAQGALPVTSLTQNLAQIAVIVIGILILLNFLGLSITPLLTALGVGGLAVALGLQDTLANFFAGFHVSLSGYVRPGDYIKLSSGEEGHVADIGWRNTTIKALANNLIIIPNLKLAQSIVTNYHLPEKRISLSIPVSIGYEYEPAQIEKILLEVAQTGITEIPGLLAEPEPVVRLNPGFGSSSLEFSLICQVSEFADQYPVQHELRKRIWARLRLEKIKIPFPTRTIYLREESGDADNH